MSNVQLLGLFVLLVGCTLLLSYWKYVKRQRQLQNFAKKFRGTVHQRSALGWSYVLLQLGEKRARLEYTPSGSRSALTHLEVSLSKTRLRLELREQGLGKRLSKLLGISDIEVGSSEFDDAFLIQGNDPQRIREFLTSPIQQAISKLAHSGRYPHLDLHLNLADGRLRITKHQYIQSEEDLTRFTEACQELLQAIAQPQKTEIRMLEEQSPVPWEETECQVCGEALTENIVLCATCKTPHHQDCWHYFGSCAVYGCGQKRYVPARRTAQANTSRE